MNMIKCKWRTFAFLVLACLVTATTLHGMPGEQPSRTSSVELEGRLVDVRCHLLIRQSGARHSFCGVDLKARRLPLALVGENDALIYLDGGSQDLAPMVGRKVRIRAQVSEDGRTAVVRRLVDAVSSTDDLSLTVNP